jgi:dTDP-4-dehydrorhamnose 3,5-epimerase-like enzyme
MKKEEITEIEYLNLIEHEKDENPRGIFHELYNSVELEDLYPIQIFVSVLNRNSLQGLYLSNAQKLITCLSGSIFVAVVDLRIGSSTPNIVHSVVLDKPNKSLMIPEECAVGIMAHVNSTVLHIQDDIWKKDRVVNWKSFDIKWPNRKKYIMSEVDRLAPKWTQPK